MSANNVFLKTSLGVQEVQSRGRKLPPKLRTMLILIDGQQPETTLRTEARQIGAPDDFLEQLLESELIMKRAIATASAISPAETDRAANEFNRFRAAKDFMNVSVVDAIGIRSFFFTLKLERAGTIAELRLLEAGYTALIAKASGMEMATVLSKRLRELLI